MVHWRCAESVHDVENAINKSIRFGVHSSVHIKNDWRYDFTATPVIKTKQKLHKKQNKSYIAIIKSAKGFC